MGGGLADRPLGKGGGGGAGGQGVDCFRLEDGGGGGGGGGGSDMLKFSPYERV